MSGRRARWWAVGLIGAAIVVVALDRALPPELDRLAALGTEIRDRHGQVLALLPAPGGVWRLRTTVDDVPPALIDALVRTEDRRYWRHPGVDPIALSRALLQDIRAGRIVSGGSTLTMQVVRLLHPRPRTWGAKAMEVLRALQLEAHLSKRDILGLWLTLAPEGGNLEGITAAAHAWFGVSPRALDPEQSALLVAIPRRPEALRPDRHASRARAVASRVLGAAADVPTHRLAMPRHAWPAVAALAPAGERVATTLDLPLQAALERLAAERLRDLPPRASLAIVVADLAAHAVTALVSGDGPDADRAGYLDLTVAVRSPGSALKPFVYGVAFDDGIAAPGTLLDDTPHRFGGYAPEDFDRGFAGRVTAAEALRRSLNLPAVELLQRVGPLRLLGVLRATGVAVRLPPGADASLPLALGGAGVSPRGLASLYAALAGDGTTAPLSLVASDRPPTVRLLSPRAAGSVASVLTQRFPEGGPPGVAWKTGTSWGGRDAWAAGFDAAHVAVVWVGRPDGSPLPGATGRALALPLLARAMALLPAAPRPEPAPVMPERPSAAAPAADAVRLLFPPPGAVLAGEGRVVLRAMGGRRPLTFLVDGAPLASAPARRETAWQPASAGFYRIGVIDADGRADHATVRVR